MKTRLATTLIILFVCGLQFFAFGRDNELSVFVGQTVTYTYSDDDYTIVPQWDADGGGTVSSSSVDTVGSSFVYSAVIEWTTVGTWNLTFKDAGILMNTWVVQVAQAMPDPPSSTTGGERCGEGSVQLSATLGNGATDIWWYDGSGGSANKVGEGTSWNTPSIDATRTYYAASHNAGSGLTNSTRVPATATINYPTVSAPVVTGNTRFGPGTLTLTATGDPGTFTWYTYSGSYVATGASYTTIPLNFGSPNYRKVILTPPTGCPSPPTWVDAIIEPLPVVEGRAGIGFSPITLTTGADYSSYEWKKDGITVPGSSNTLDVNESGSYTVTVTKTGVPGSGTSDPPTVISDGQFDGVNENYITTNTVLVSGVATEAEIDNLPIGARAQHVQYLDALGRPLQSIATRASPSFLDVVRQTEFINGVEVEYKKYLPITNTLESTGNGLLKASLPEDDRPWSEISYEQSPLRRPIQTLGPGDDFYPTNLKVNQEYLANDSEIEDIIAWKIDGTGMPVRASDASGYVENGLYTSNQLSISYVKGSGNNQTRTYTDKQGRVILKKVRYLGTGALNLSDPNYWLHTYYVYDKYGNLRYELTPTLSYSLSGSSANPTQAELDKLAFQYTYDNRNRMLTSKAPSTGQVVMVYDDWDRVVMTQDANQKVDYKWSYTKYDYLSRPIISGIYTHSADIDQATMTGKIVTANEAYNGTPSTHGYTNSVFPTTSTEALAVTYYDKYLFPGDLTIPAYVSSDIPGEQPATAFDRVVGQVVGSKVKVLGTANTYLWGVTYFDDELRPVQTVAQNHLGGYDRITTAINFAGEVTESKTTHVTSSATTTISKRYTYDHSGRLKRLYHKVGTGPEILLAEYVYNEKGELAERNLHVPNPAEGGTPFSHDGGLYAHSLTLTEYNNEEEIVASQSITLLPGVHIKPNGHDVHLYISENDVQTAAQQASKGLQSVDYTRNIRGGLLGINDSSLPTDPEEPADLFGMSFDYASTASGMGNTPYYNGNISAIRWSANQGLDVTKERGYTFSYDPTNRLTAANFKEKTSSWSASAAYDENGINYDRNGNITALQRKADGTLVDNLTYTYQDTNSDRLAKVSDSANDTEGFIDGNNTGDDYTYDANGNLLQDLNKNIPVNGIEYNHLNLPTKITITDLGYFVFTYDATGRKLRQEFFDPSDVSKWHIDYDGAFIYKNDVLQQIAHEEGRYLPNGEYQYVIADHLGSSRVVFTSEPGNESATASMETTNVSEEQGEFLFYDEAVKVNSSIFDHTNQGATYYSNRLTGTELERIGLAKSLSVMPGDVIKAEVYAKYLDPNSGNWTTALANLINSIANSTAPAGTFIDGGAAGSTGGVAFPFADDIGKSGETGTAPKAYLNYLIFDRDFEPLTNGFVRLTTDAREYGQDAPHERLAVEFTITQPGYVYVFLSNDNVELGGDPIETYWDDFSVEHIQSPVVQMQDYYPFGLAYNSYLREDTRRDKFLFQGKERIDTLGIYDFHARLYSGELGRFLSVDPKKQFASGYVGMGNSPLMGVDPDGQFWNFVIGAAVGGVSSYIAGRKAGLRGSDLAGFVFGGIAIGTISGGVGAAVGQSILSAGASSIIAGAAGGAAGGFTGGYFSAAQSGGNTLQGGLKGAVSGLVGGSVASAIAGGGGAFLAGASAGATSAALNGGDWGDIGLAAAIGGGLAFGTYYSEALIKFSQDTENDYFNALSNKEKFIFSRLAQKSAAYRREYAFRRDKEGNISGIIKGDFLRKYNMRALQRNGGTKFAYSHKFRDRYNHHVKNAIFDFDRKVFHIHLPGGNDGFSIGPDADISNMTQKMVSHGFMAQLRGDIYHWSFVSQTSSTVGSTNKYLMSDYLFGY